MKDVKPLNDSSDEHESQDSRLSEKGVTAIQGESVYSKKTDNEKLGRNAELIAYQQLKEESPDAIDLNEVHANFPIYDVAGPNCVASVKHFGLDYGNELPGSILGNYRSAFREAIGRGTNPEKFEDAANKLKDLKESGESIPDDLQQNPEDYLMKNAQLWIPSEHVELLKSDLKDRLLSKDKIMRSVSSEQFGIDAHTNDYEEEVGKLLDRIKPIEL